MKRYNVTLFVLGLPEALQDFRDVEIQANSQEEASKLLTTNMFLTVGAYMIQKKLKKIN